MRAECSGEYESAADWRYEEGCNAGRAAPAAPAEESKTESLIAPGAPQIPLPDTPVLDLSPVPEAGTAAEKAKLGPDAGAAGKSETTKTTRTLPEIPPPVDELPASNPKKEESAQPVAPLPELPLPSELPPANEVLESSGKPLDPQAVKCERIEARRSCEDRGDLFPEEASSSVR